ncbi:hypothetical protein [Sulfuricurvum sp.]|uniref:hypothetical protein n=1 Tax=Sulfuricurvum sp. TaxID=2025608 RepID=UPI0035661892
MRKNEIYITSTVLVRELKYSRNVANGFMTSFLFYAPLLKRPAFIVGSAVDLLSCLAIARYRHKNCSVRGCKVAYSNLIKKLEKFQELNHA